MALRNGLHLEEHLTATRQRILSRCRELRTTGSLQHRVIREVRTEGGNVYVVVERGADGGGPAAPGGDPAEAAGRRAGRRWGRIARGKGERPRKALI